MGRQKAWKPQGAHSVVGDTCKAMGSRCTVRAEMGVKYFQIERLSLSYVDHQESPDAQIICNLDHKS